MGEGCPEEDLSERSEAVSGVLRYAKIYTSLHVMPDRS